MNAFSQLRCVNPEQTYGTGGGDPEKTVNGKVPGVNLEQSRAVSPWCVRIRNWFNEQSCQGSYLGSNKPGSAPVLNRPIRLESHSEKQRRNIYSMETLGEKNKVI